MANDGMVEPISFVCGRCVHDGITSPPTLAVVGDVPEPTVIVRTPERRLSGVALADDWRNLPTADRRPMPAGNTAVARLLPRARHRVNPAPGVRDGVRASFVVLPANEQRLLVCPRDHGVGVQVSRSNLLRRADKARASGDRWPTLG